MSIDTASMNQAMLKLAAHIKEKKPYLFTIDEEIGKIENGIIGLQVRVYKGSVTDVVVTPSKRFTFKQTK